VTGQRRGGAHLLVAAALAGCALMEPQAPSVETGLDADDRYAAAEPGAPAPQPADLHWWRRLDDPLVTEWVERALAAAPDVAIGRERIAQAEAALRVAQAQHQPAIAAFASANYDTRPTGRNRRGRVSAGLTLEWDADLAGGLRFAERSAAARLLGAHEQMQATRLALAGLTARSVIAYREAVRDAQLLAQAHAVQQAMLGIVRVRVDAGLSPRLDLEGAQAELAAIEADRAAAAVRVRQAFAALQLAAGERPQPPTLQAVSMAPEKEPLQQAVVPALVGVQPVGRPLDLLRRRPDLRAAQRALEADVADIGVARAALRPSLRLPGTLAVSSRALAAVDFVSASIAAVIDAAVFDAGRREAEVDAAEARARESALVYRKTLLQALGEVEAALVGSEGASARIDALRRSTRAAQAAVDDARTLYTAGLSEFLNVLDARRTALERQRELLRARADSARFAVATFEALGLIDEPDASMAPKQDADRGLARHP
jgi:NodT family efflux transporter outer membrane factor (OMF) lipoprotein